MTVVDAPNEVEDRAARDGAGGAAGNADAPELGRASPNAGTLRTDRGPMFALRAGSGPPVLFLHGVTAHAYVWDPVLRQLADRFTVVAVDQRGHGRTGTRDADPTVDRTWDAASYAKDALSAARALDLGPVLVVGHSLGARNALVAGSLDPIAVAGVVAIDFTPFIEVGVFAALEARVSGGGDAVPDLGAARAVLRRRYPNLPHDAIERRAANGFRPDGTGWSPMADSRAMGATCRGLRADLAGPLRSISVPTLLVRGENSTVVSRAAWHATTALRPDIDAREVGAADHYVPEERPAVIAELIASFASERAAWSGPDVNRGARVRADGGAPWKSR